MKQEPRKFEKKELIEKKEEIKEFLKEEYMKSQHFKKKIENFKINKVMGRIRKRAKGPNPLSVKKKREKLDHIEKNINENEKTIEMNKGIEREQHNQSNKRERKRFKKVKSQQ